MTEKSVCPQCGNELPRDASVGICPRRLLLVGMRETSPKMATAILRDSTGPSDPANILPRPVAVVEGSRPWCRHLPAIARLTAGLAASLLIGTLVSLSFARQANQLAREARHNATMAVREKQRADDEANQAVLNATRAGQQTQDAKANEKRANLAAMIFMGLTTYELSGPFLRAIRGFVIGAAVWVVAKIQLVRRWWRLLRVARPPPRCWCQNPV